MAQYIPLIHDYCDRWCDHCAFKERCAYIQGKLDISENEESLKMIAWESKQYGLDMDERATSIMTLEKVAQIEELLENEELVKAATEFRDLMKTLLEDFSYWTKMATDRVKQTVSRARDGGEVLQEVRLMDKCRDLLCWDFIFIGAKVRRAVAGQLMSQAIEGPQCDSNGSAKVALISVKRSLIALRQIFKFSRDDDRFLVPLSLLARIEKLLKEKFPQADDFVRPGFDTEIALMQKQEVIGECLN